MPCYGKPHLNQRCGTHRGNDALWRSSCGLCDVYHVVSVTLSCGLAHVTLRQLMSMSLGFIMHYKTDLRQRPDRRETDLRQTPDKRETDLRQRPDRKESVSRAISPGRHHVHERRKGEWVTCQAETRESESSTYNVNLKGVLSFCEDVLLLLLAPFSAILVLSLSYRPPLLSLLLQGTVILWSSQLGERAGTLRRWKIRCDLGWWVMRDKAGS